MSKRCIIYCRVSTDAQERDGTSLETQQRACVEYAKAGGLTVVESVSDTASGFTLERPGLARIRAAAANDSVDVVLSYALDRLSRKQTHVAILVEEMEQIGVTIDFVTEHFEDTATGQLLRSVKAFAAELEREKIAERTMRGKVERARSGRLPQGTGRGTYGYTYSRETGQRKIAQAQAVVVRRIFARYAETRSFSRVSRDLNESGVPAFGGGRWYPLTIRRVLKNEAYVGRTTYLKTKRVTGRRGHKSVVARPTEDHIDVPGATPAIVDDAAWDRVQKILNDPDRMARRPTAHRYDRRGRTKCGICGGSTVGQTVTSKAKPYKYYRCRHVYDPNTKRDCSTRYVRGDHLADGVWREIRAVLSSPEIVLHELTRDASNERDDAEATALQSELNTLGRREERLVRLFGLGDVDEAVVRAQLAEVSAEKRVIEQRLAQLTVAVAPALPVDESQLRRACDLVAQWLDNASDDDRDLVLEALQVGVVATKHEATVSGVLPVCDENATAREFVTDEQSCRCLFNGIEKLAHLTYISPQPPFEGTPR